MDTHKYVNMCICARLENTIKVEVFLIVIFQSQRQGTNTTHVSRLPCELLFGENETLTLALWHLSLQYVTAIFIMTVTGK